MSSSGLQPGLCLQMPEQGLVTQRDFPWVRNISLKPPCSILGSALWGHITNFCPLCFCL